MNLHCTASPSDVGMCCLVYVCAGGPPHRPGMAADVVTKPCHYRKAASATSELQPQLSIHFGVADQEIANLHNQGELNLKHLTGSGSDGSKCSSQLHCARKESTPSGDRDICGLVGGVCLHGFPVRGSFADIRSPENYSIYLVMLFWVVFLSGYRIHFVWIDFACQLCATWERFMRHQVSLAAARVREAEAAIQVALEACHAAVAAGDHDAYLAACAAGTQAEADRDRAVEARDRLQRVHASIQLVVNFMHGAGHTLACQLLHCGRHIVGTGWGVGEQIEQLWSLTKVCTAPLAARTP